MERGETQTSAHRLAPHHARGQVLLMMVMAILLLTGLVFFVMNTGDQVNRRTAAQNAADSAALSGGIHMARGLNTLAMNNIAMSRELSLIPVMDSLPLAARMTWEYADALEKSLGAQLQRISATSPWNGTIGKQDTWNRFEELRSRAAQDRATIEPLDTLLNSGGYDVHAKTTYRIPGTAGPTPHGSFWQAARHLDQFNQATVASFPVSAQLTVSRFAAASQDDSSAPPHALDGGFVVPLAPELPARRGTWRDWHRNSGRDSLLRRGRIPDYAEPYRLGPFAMLFRWRDAGGRPAEFVPGNSDTGGGGAGGSIGRWIATGPPGPEYRTYGPFEWMMRHARTVWPAAELRVEVYGAPGVRGERWALDALASVKLDYMFNPPQQLARVHYPQWVDDFARARTLHAGGARVYQTFYGRTSRIVGKPPDGFERLRDRNWHDNDASGMHAYPMQKLFDRTEPDRPSQPVVISVRLRKHGTRLLDYLWEATFSPAEVEAAFEAELARRRARNPQAQFVPREPYPEVIVQEVFMLADVGGEWPISNPANFDSTAALPAPMLLDTSRGDYEYIHEDQHLGHDEGVRREQFTLLGVARRSARPTVTTVWQRRFDSANPLRSVVAAAQVEVYNPVSWDLWTQSWRAQLVPVTHLAPASRLALDEPPDPPQLPVLSWAERLHDDLADPGRFDATVNPAAARDMAEFFANFRERFADLVINH